jgi:hypothetical protein
MNATTLYTFDPHTFEYTGSRPAQVVGGKALTISAFATPDAPPDVHGGYVALWDGTDWTVMEDHRQQMDEKGNKSGGTAYWLPGEGDDNTSPARYMAVPGPLPDGAVTEQPAQPALTTEQQATAIRAERDRRIAATDYLVMPDYPLTTETLEEVKTYRQALRDLPDQKGFPWGGDVSAVPWPVKPSL